MERRFFEGDRPQATRLLEDHFSRLSERWERDRVPARALVLGGGYGRGEGGVTESGALYNDLDYFLFADDPERPELERWCRAVETEETAVLGVDVEIKRLSPGAVAAGLRTMMFADLVAGHAVVAGDAGFLDALEADFTTVGAEEASRLLWNRGSGLLFARNSSEASFIERNHAKLKLALGDAKLCLGGRYVPQCRERGRRVALIEGGAGVDELKRWHAEAVEWKFRPRTDMVRPDAELKEESFRLAAAWERMWLEVESSRLSRPFPTMGSYLEAARVFLDSRALRNVALAFRDRIKRGGNLRPVRDYPRGALMRALPCLLELGGMKAGEAGRFLPEGTVGCYEKWWRFYS